MEADGTGLLRLTEDPAADQNPAWSPDGERIVFSSERTGSGDLYVMDVDGGNVEQLTDHPAYEGAPRFSPDGQGIVFEAERDGRAEIYFLILDTREVERITSSGTRKLGPAFSPEGTRVAYMEKGLISWQVTVREWKHGHEEVVTRGGGSCRPSFSPDGKLLAYVTTKDTPKADIWLREMGEGRDGAAWRVVSRESAHNYDPAFAPDSVTLAMASTRTRGNDEQWDLFVMDLNGRNLYRLTGDEGNERFPDWKPRSS